MAQPANTGADFDDADVARAYRHRPPYPPALFQALKRLAAGRRGALDLGCGPGKLAAGLADGFDQVWAVDPSRPMLDAGRSLHAAANIRWILSTAEGLDAPPAGFDLAVAGASIHWMDPQVVFPRLARWLSPGARIAIVEGDGPAEASWLDDYRAAIRGWVERIGGTWNDPAMLGRGRAHEAWIGEPVRRAFAHEVRQRVEDLIDCEHSRATWSRAKLGAERSAAFDADLRAILAPHADAEGMVTYVVRTQLLHGTPLEVAPSADHRATAPPPSRR